MTGELKVPQVLKGANSLTSRLEIPADSKTSKSLPCLKVTHGNSQTMMSAPHAHRQNKDKLIKSYSG